jgi:hypothetical protein
MTEDAAPGSTTTEESDSGSGSTAAESSDSGSGSTAAESSDSGSGSTAAESSDSGSGSTYAGVLTAFPYAFRESESRAFRVYAALSGLFTLLLAFYFAAAVTVAVSNTLGAAGGTFTFSRSFLVFVALAVVAPVVAPVLFVAREHRRGRATPAFDARMAALGGVYALAVYAAAIISMPPEFTLDGDTVTRPPPSGLLAPLIRVLYAMPPLSSVLPPAVVALAMYLLDRRHRSAT